MSEFMIVMRGSFQNWEAISAQEKQEIMERYMAFVKKLRDEKRFKGGSALKNGSVKLKSTGGDVVVDGPFTESKEALNGYFVYEAEDMQQAVAIARSCPALTHGESVEVIELTDH